jgi:hypothetical protein
MSFKKKSVCAPSAGRFMSKISQAIGIIAVCTAMMCTTVTGAPVPVRFLEGSTHGFLVLRSDSGEMLAQGESIQNVQGDRVDSRLVFRFKDGSLHDETVSFSQQRVFTMLTYRLVQRGPSFPNATEVSMDRKTGEYQVRSRSGIDGPEETISGRFDLPADVYNGMAVTLLRNLQSKSETVRFVAFTPTPKIINLLLLSAGKEMVLVGDVAKSATRYSLQPQLGVITRFFGKLLGKLPQNFHYYFWILNDDVPTFVRFEGPLYLHGENWSIELLSPRLPAKGDEKSKKLK